MALCWTARRPTPPMHACMRGRLATNPLTGCAVGWRHCLPADAHVRPLPHRTARARLRSASRGAAAAGPRARRPGAARTSSSQPAMTLSREPRPGIVTVTMTTGRVAGSVLAKARTSTPARAGLGAPWPPGHRRRGRHHRRHLRSLRCPLRRPLHRHRLPRLPRRCLRRPRPPRRGSTTLTIPRGSGCGGKG